MKRKTNLLVIAAIALGAWLVQPTTASAETVKTTRKTRVMARPGESSRVIKRLPSGRTMTVLARKGRWLKVRVGSENGYVTRTSVISTQTPRAARSSSRNRRRASFVEGRSSRRFSDSAPEDRRGESAVDDDFEGFEEEPERFTEEEDLDDEPRRSRRDFDDEEDFDDRGFEDDDDEDFDDEPEDDDTLVVVVDSADAYRKPNSRSGSAFEIEEGDSLTLIKASDSGKWMFVEDGRGDRGWVRADQVATSGGAYQYEKLSYDAGAGLAYTALNQQFRTPDGVGSLANYDISSAAYTVGLQGELTYKYSEDWLLGANLGLNYSAASPGIRFDDGAGNAADIGFSILEAHPTVRGGYNFHHEMGLALYGRAGYLYNKFNVSDGTNLEANLARLPSELLTGVTLGVQFEAPQITDKIPARFTADMLLGGSLSQTEGLEDGQTSSVSSLWGNLQVEYKLEKFDVYGSIRYLTQTSDFEGNAASERGHNATSAQRKDSITTFGVGVIKTF